jgi:hypothetical protein
MFSKIQSVVRMFVPPFFFNLYGLVFTQFYEERHFMLYTIPMILQTEYSPF